jgi:hypothetical protein
MGCATNHQDGDLRRFVKRLRLRRGHPLSGRPFDPDLRGDEVTILPAVAGG